MRLTVRKSGEVILGLTELEAVTLVEVIAVVKEASDEQPKFFNRTQKAVLRDTHKLLQGLDEAIDKAESNSPAEEDAVVEPAESVDTPTAEAV